VQFLTFITLIKTVVASSSNGDVKESKEIGVSERTFFEIEIKLLFSKAVKGHFIIFINVSLLDLNFIELQPMLTI